MFNTTKNLIGGVILSLFFSSCAIADEIWFYIVPHEDDWQLFMSPLPAIHYVRGTVKKMVFIYLTAGDGGALDGLTPLEGSTLSNQYCPLYIAREMGAINATKFISDRTGMSDRSIFDYTMQSRFTTGGLKYRTLRPNTRTVNVSDDTLAKVYREIQFLEQGRHEDATCTPKEGMAGTPSCTLNDANYDATLCCKSPLYNKEIVSYFLRLPDGNVNGNGYNNSNTLKKLFVGFDDNTSPNLTMKEVGGAQTYTYKQIRRALINIIKGEIGNNQPYNVYINTMNPFFHPTSSTDNNMRNDGNIIDHEDHIYTAKIVQAARSVGTSPTASSLDCISGLHYFYGYNNIEGTADIPAPLTDNGVGTAPLDAYNNSSTNIPKPVSSQIQYDLYKSQNNFSNNWVIVNANGTSEINRTQRDDTYLKLTIWGVTQAGIAQGVPMSYGDEHNKWLARTAVYGTDLNNPNNTCQFSSSFTD